MTPCRDPVIRAALAVAMAMTAPCALGYVGPGAGLSLLGALAGLVAAIVAAVGAIVLYPIRRARRRAKERMEPSETTPEQDTDNG